MFLDEIERKYRWAEDARRVYEKQWIVNLAFYLGEQWVYYSPETKTVENAKARFPEHKVALVINYVRPTVRTELAKLTKQKPSFLVVANSQDYDDKEEARVKNAVLDYIYHTLKLEFVSKDALLWAILTGKGFIYYYWDADAGDMIIDYAVQLDENGNPITDEEGNPIPVVREDGSYAINNVFHIGELRAEACGPFEIYVDPLSKTDDDMRWFFRDKIMNIEDVYAKFGVEVPTESVKALSYLSGKILGPRNLDRKDVCTIREYWERPSPLNPAGRYVVYTAGSKILLYEGENPYADTGVDLPLASVTHIPVPGSYYGDSVVTDLVPINVSYNKTRSQIVEVQNLMAWPKIKAPIGSLSIPPSSRPGEVVEYNASAGPQPEFWTPPTIPGYVLRELDRAKEEIIEVSGIHEASRGYVPSNIRSGVAIAYIQEQDDTRLNVTARSYEKMLERVLTGLLRLARKYYVEPRTIRIIGPEKTHTVKQFYGQDIPADADVHVEAGSSLPKSTIAKQQLILDMWNARLIQDPAVALRLLEFGNVEDLYYDSDLDIEQANRENEILASGAYHPVEDFENHELHIRTHNRFRKSVVYDDLPVEIKNLFAQHIAEHQGYLQNAMQAMVAPQAQAGGIQIPGLEVMLGGGEAGLEAGNQEPYNATA